jgi:hypothetical protein
VPRIFIGGLVAGRNYPDSKDGYKAFFIDADKCNDMIVVDRKYFIENNGLIQSWAMYVEKTSAEVISQMET